MSRARSWIAVCVELGAGLAALAGCCTAGVAAAMLRPSEPFDAAAVPRAPDYRDDAAWLALPSTIDAADTTIDALPVEPAQDAAIDVFYVHSTSSVRPEWIAPVDDPEIRAASIRGGTLIQGSVFNAVGAVYAPEYRQATGTAFVTASESGARAIEIAYADVRAAFNELMRRTGGERPFIVAAHSQGSVLAVRLVREEIATSARRTQLVAAYLIGAPVTADDIAQLRACAAPAEHGCVIAYNARGPGHEPNAIEFGRAVSESSRLCVNPTLGRATTERAAKSAHRGALFLDAPAPALLTRFAASACAQGRLVVTEMDEVPRRTAADGVLLWVMGVENFHPIEYQLFYADLRADVARRAASFLPP